MKTLTLLLSLIFLSSCGSGEEDDQQASVVQTTEVNQCGDFTVDLSQAAELGEEAEEEGVDGADEFNTRLLALEGSVLPPDSVIVVGCGGDLHLEDNDTSTTTTTTTDTDTNIGNTENAKTLKRAIAAGDLATIELR